MSTAIARKLFGTDGIRGIAGQSPLDATTVYATGLALGHSLRKTSAARRVILGRDTRESSPWITTTLAAGLRKAGTAVESAGIVPTPAVAFLAHTHGFGAGVVISASHNPWRDNGIKLFGADGFKLPDAVELAMEDEILHHAATTVAPDAKRLPSVEDNAALRDDYIQFLIGCVPGLSLAGLRIVADCANGAAAAVAPDLFQRLGGDVRLLNIAPDGLVHRGVTDYVGPGKTAQAAPAVDDLVARARAGSPDNPLYVIAIGAISNVASALLKAPDIIDRIVVVWLGGHALEWPHTIEFNLKQDVGGAQVLFDSGVPLVLVPCKGVTSHLHSTVPEIERYVEPHGSIGAFLAQRFKDYSSDHLGWAKEIWDMAPVGWLLNPEWAPSVIIPAPVLTDQITWSVDRRRHAIRYVTYVDRNPILKDFFLKLKAFAELK